MSASAPTHPGTARLARLAGELRERELEGMLVGDLLNVRYLTGFRGSHGLVLAAAGGAPAALRERLLTDFRYETQAAQQLPAGLPVEIASGDLLEAAAAGLPAGGGRLGFEEAHVSVRAHRRLRELVPAGWELVGCEGLVEGLRAVKDAGEIALVRAAAELADRALEGLLEGGITGRSERELAGELELRMRRLGAEAASFPTIVAAGPHAALPHAAPREEPIGRDLLVTIDWGARHEGYCSDCTRTYATGASVGEQAREVYELVLAAQLAGVAAVRAGRGGREIDAAARRVIERGGQGERFGHGLGHGVGLDIHEGPRLSRTAGPEPLRAGNVVTVEPGVYLPGVLGVRIEDLVVVGEDGCELLTHLPKELTVVS